MKRSAFASRLAFACLAALAPSLFAAPMDDRVPQDAIAYIGWQGADSLAPQYAQSNLRHIVESSGLGAYLQQQMPRWIEQAAQRDPEAPQHIAKALTALNVIWHHPTAVYVGPMDWTDMKSPSPRMALLCDAGSDAAGLLTLLQEAVKSAPPKPAPQMAVSATNGMVIFTVGSVDATTFAVGPNTLRANPDYQRVMKVVGGSDGAYVAYGDPQKFFATLDEGLSKDTKLPPDVRTKVHAVIETLGLSHMTQGAARGGFDGAGWTDTAFIGTQGTRTGVLDLAATPPLTDADLVAVPADAASMAAGRFDFSKTLALARDVVASIDPNALDKFNAGIAMADLQVGFDIEKDLVGSLGDLYLMYRLPSPDGVGIANALVTPLKDGDKFAKVLSAVETLINEKGGGRVQVEPLDADGIPVSAVQSPFASVAWTVRNGHFYISTFAAISAVVNQVEKHQPSITTSDAYKKARAALPNVPPTSISFTDPARLYPEAYRVLSSTIPMLRMAKIDVPMRIFPTPAKATPFMAPGMSLSWVEANGFHFAGKSSFPGAEGVQGPVTDSPVVTAALAGATDHQVSTTNAAQTKLNP